MKKISNLKTAIRCYERKIICEMLQACDWDKKKTAKSFDIGLSSLYRKMVQHNITSR